MKSAVLALLMLGFATLSFAAPRHAYTLVVPAANARSITFDVQEGDLIIRGDPAATSVHIYYILPALQPNPAANAHEVKFPADYPTQPRMAGELPTATFEKGPSSPSLKSP